MLAASVPRAVLSLQPTLGPLPFMVPQVPGIGVDRIVCIPPLASIGVIVCGPLLHDALFAVYAKLGQLKWSLLFKKRGG